MACWWLARWQNWKNLAVHASLTCTNILSISCVLLVHNVLHRWHASQRCLTAGLNLARCPVRKQHYPFTQKTQPPPADFIAEGLDQTRGWFYTLNVLAAALFDQPAFRNVVVNGTILDAHGKKNV